MEGSAEDCSPLWGLYQQIVADMKNSAPLWEDFISKATKLHSALKSALSAVASFLDAFQRVADAATGARGATKEIGTALTRVCLRQRAIEARLKTFVSMLMDGLITPLSERAEDWRRGACGGGGTGAGGAATGAGALGREHARECKRVRAELRRRMHEAQRALRKARRQPPDARRRADVCLQEAAERRQQLEELEERAVKAALVEERARFCHFVALLQPLIECEVALVSEIGHLQEGGEQLVRQAVEPRALPAASLQALCDVKAAAAGWSADAATAAVAPHSPTPSSRLGSRKCSLTSISSIGTNHHDESDSTVSCSTPVSGASGPTEGGARTPVGAPAATPPATPLDYRHCLSMAKAAVDASVGPTPARTRSTASADSGFRSQEALHRQLSLYFDNCSDALSVSSEGGAPASPSPAAAPATPDRNTGCPGAWPEMEDTAQFERAASAILADRDRDRDQDRDNHRPHTISAAGYERAAAHARPALSVHTFAERERDRDQPVYARPPLPTRCSSLERPAVPCKGGGLDPRTAKPSSLPPHLTKEMPQAVYVNMSELASLAAARAQLHHQHNAGANAEPAHHDKVCCESSASESSLESSSGYGSQGACDHHASPASANASATATATANAPAHALLDVDCEIVTLRRERSAGATAGPALSLASLDEAVRCLSAACDAPAFATVGRARAKPAPPKRRPLSLATPAPALITVPAPALLGAGGWSRRGSSSSLGRPPPPVRRSSSISRPQRPAVGAGAAAGTEAELPPPPAFLLQPDNDSSVLAPAAHSEGAKVAEAVKQLTELRHTPASPALPRRSPTHVLGSFGAAAAVSANPASVTVMPEDRKGSLSSSGFELFRDGGGGETHSGPPTPAAPAATAAAENSLSSFGPRVVNDSHYGQTGFKLQQEKRYQSNTIYAQPSQIIAGFNSVTLARAGAGGVAGGGGGEPLSPLALRKNIAARSHSADRRGPPHAEQGGLLAALSAKLSPRAPRRAPATHAPAPAHADGARARGSPAAGGASGAAQAAFLDKLSATLQQQRRSLESARATTVRDIINAHAKPDPRACHSSLMEQIKRGATLRRNRHCNDRSAPHIR